ncbi:gamma-glutamyltransferase, partial [Streptomyces pathocidini]
AEALAEAAARPTMDTSGERHTGTLTGGDLAAFSATYEDPAAYDWNGWTVCKAGGWSQGPVFLQQLALLPDDPAGLDYGSAAYVHRLIEGTKLAMADREAWYGDAEGPGTVPLDDLLSRSYNAERRTLLGAEASYELRPGSPDGREPRLSRHARVAAAGEALPPHAGTPGTGEPTVARDDAATVARDGAAGVVG